MLLFLFACADKVDRPADEQGCVESPWYADADGDGHGDPDVSTFACEAPEGHVAAGDDCDDTDAAVSPSEQEVCGGGDEDCSGEEDDGAVDASSWYEDGDGDGYGGEADVHACEPPRGYVAQGGDCNDGRDEYHPGAPETPESFGDTDCDGLITCYADADGDGFGGASYTDSDDADCADAGEAGEATDCDDRDATVNPSGTERCDFGDIDDDCDGLVDEADPDLSGSATFYADADQDGAGDAATAVTATCAPDGYVSIGDDCDDADPDTRPLATETCADTVDRNCDGQVGAADHDGDGVAACEECDDGDAAVFPGAAEVALDGRDDDCDGLVDEAAGDVALATDADVAAFCAAYASVEGSLDVSGLANLRDLGCLRAVGGHLRVADVTGPDLRGLEALTDVRGDLLLGGWQEGVGVLAPSGFTALTGLGRLRRIGGDAWIAQNEVADLSGAPLLASVGGSFILLDLPLADVSLTLTTLGDDLWLETLPALTTVAAPSLTSFGGSLWLQDLAADSGGFTLDWTLPIPGTLGLVLLPAGVADAGWTLPDAPGGLHVEATDLADLGALAHLTRVDGDVLIEDNAALADLAALDGVEEIAGDLGVVSNAGLVGWDDFAGLVRVGGTLRLAGDGPVSASGFGALEQIGEGLVVEDTRDLATIDGFGGLATCPDLDLSAGALTDASGLAGVPFDGDVSVTNSFALTDVSFLSGVTTLHSLALTWNNGLTSLAGLEGLGDVAAALEIADDRALVDAALPALVTVGGALTVEDLDALVTLDLGALQVVGGDVALADLNALSNLDLRELREVGGLWIWRVDGLTDLSGLDGLTSVEGSLVLEDNDGLLTLGLSSLRTVGGDLQVESHVALLDLGGLDALVSVGNDLTIQYNSSLVRPDSLGALTMIGRDLWVEQNAALLDLRGLGDVAIGNTVWLFGNSAMTSLDGLDGLDEVPGHLVLALSALTDVSALASLARVGGDMHIAKCEALVSLSGLDALAEIGGSLEIGEQVTWGGWSDGLDALTTLDGLGGLRTVGEHLWIGDNPVLVDISALDGLRSVGGELGVVDNPLLPTEDAETLSDGSPAVGGGVTISGNL